MKFCEKCGSPVPEGTKFCSKCGNPLSAQAVPGTNSGPAASAADENESQENRNIPPVQPFPQQNQAQPSFDYGFGYNSSGSASGTETGKKGSGKLVLILLLVIAALIGGIIFLLFQSGILNFGGGKSTGSSYEYPVQQLMASIEQQDGQMIIDVLPDEFIDLQTDYYDSEQELAEALEYYVFSGFDQYSSIDVSYHITDRDHLDSDDLDELIEDYSNNFNITPDITDAYELKLDAEITADGERFSPEYSLNVIEIDGIWYLDILSL